jgi:hypothetical protein
VIERTLVDPADPRCVFERWGLRRRRHPHRARRHGRQRDAPRRPSDLARICAGVDPLDDDATAVCLCGTWRTLVVAGAAGDPDRTVARLAERRSGVAAFADAGSPVRSPTRLPQACADHARRSGRVRATAAALAEQYARESA